MDLIWYRWLMKDEKVCLFFEDDIKFMHYFRDWMDLGEVKDNILEWDRMGSHVSNRESGIVKYLIKKKNC